MICPLLSVIESRLVIAVLRLRDLGDDSKSLL